MRTIVISCASSSINEAVKKSKELECDGYKVIGMPKKIDANNIHEYKKAFELFYKNLKDAAQLYDIKK